MGNNYKVIVAHPGKQHSMQLAVAMERAGMLDSYITTVYDKPGSITHFITRLLKGNNKKKASGRKTEEIPENKIVQFCELRGLILLALIRLPRICQSDFRWCQYVNNVFSKKVAKFAEKRGVDAVIMFDTASEKGFSYLIKCKSNILKIMDVSIATRFFMKNTYEKDYALNELKKEYPEYWNEHYMRGYKAEIDYTDHFLVASKMSGRSLEFCGISKDKYSIIPYGVNHNQFEYEQKKVHKGPIRLIFVGFANYRKGIHHLLRVIDRFDENEFDVTIAGMYDSSNDIYNNYKDKKNIHFIGFVTRDLLAREYKKADAFVFPTIGEGYGLVILEALSCGLPAIVSNLAGGDDAIIEGYNGYVFEGGNDDALEETLRIFQKEYARIEQLSAQAHESVKDFTWEKYYSDVSARVAELIKEHRAR